MSAHKVHSPSSAHRRRLCPGSLAACKGIPNTNNFFAAEGTAYHFVASSVLEHLAMIDRNGYDGGDEQGAECADWVGLYVHVTPETCYSGLPAKQPGDDFVFKIDEENAAKAQVYVDAMLRRKLYSPNVRQLYEVKLDTSRVIDIDDQGGTGDCVTLDFENLTIYVDDLKFGKGKQVFAFWTDENGVKQPNDQCAEYGAAALRMFRCLAPWKKVVVGIHMPRLQGFVDELEMSVEELDAWVANVCKPYEQAAHKLYVSGTEEQIFAALKPSKEACTFCPLDGGQCKAQLQDALAAFPIVQQPDGLNTAKTAMWKATDEEFLQALDLAERYADFWGSVFGEGLRRLQAGSSLPGWKMVMGNKGHRKLDDTAILPPLTDESGAEIEPATKVSELLVAELGSEAYAPQEFLTASKLGDLLSKKGRSAEQKAAAVKRQELWKRLQHAISQPDGKPQIVREGDVRPPMARAAGIDEFAIIPNQ